MLQERAIIYYVLRSDPVKTRLCVTVYTAGKMLALPKTMVGLLLASVRQVYLLGVVTGTTPTAEKKK